MEIRPSDYENYDYRDFWKDNQRQYEDLSERMAIRKLLPAAQDKEKVFVDIGCGFGRLFNEYKNFGTIIMIDYSFNNLKKAKDNIRRYLGPDSNRLPNIHFIAADALRLPLKPNVSDYIFTVRLIHHIDRPQIYFDQVERVLKNGGSYILEFANKRNIKNILRYAAGKIDISPFNLLPYKVGDTILNYHPAHILELVENRNFKILKLLSVSHFRISFLKNAVPVKVLLFMENICQHALSFLKLTPSIFFKARLYKQSGKSLKTHNIEDMLSCPECGKSLIFNGNQINCSNCGKQYKRENGIYNFKQQIL